MNILSIVLNYLNFTVAFFKYWSANFRGVKIIYF